VRYGITVANVGSYADPRTAVRLARAAEAAGWEAFFVWDHLAFAWGVPAADPWVTLAAVASATDRLRLGPAVTPVARRRPQVLAQTVATLDLLSRGRVIFGAGLGGSPSEFGKFGDPEDPRIRAEMLDEGLELLRGLWSGAEVVHPGGHYVVNGVRLAPTPVQERVPIWIGGNKAPSQRRAARWDGWIPDTTYPPDEPMSPADVFRGLTSIRTLRVRSGEHFDVAVLGQSDRGDPAAYADVGASWWLESLHDRRGPPEEMLAIVEAGPPTGP
jgi:alkanesulfonate monooxygenase SsuD/methylene tetrahydromethanopterin reductase-like flavin-dependent oxidoreductase (luciferase family)